MSPGPCDCGAPECVRCGAYYGWSYAWDEWDPTPQRCRRRVKGVGWAARRRLWSPKAADSKDKGGVGDAIAPASRPPVSLGMVRAPVGGIH